MKNKIHLRTCIGVKYDLPLIRHFIEYYKDFGVDEFYITLSSHSERQNLEIAKSILKEYDIEPFDIWIGPYREHIRGEYLCNMVDHLNDDEWVLTADCDEFQEYPMELHRFVSQLDEDEVTWVEGAIVDRVSSTGEIPEKLNKKLLTSE
ncbi:MAG: hypothetical protein GY816_03675 [Cytophagales bacterium]|nr:hypothetical protein [Cytophagales bacterium]